MVLVPCQTLSRKEECASLSRNDAMRVYAEQFNADFVDRVRDAVFDRLSAIASLRTLRSWILDAVVDTPATYADRYHVGAGTPFALSHGLAQLSVTRPGPTSTDRVHVVPHHVYFCGASTRPGNGVPLVLVGAKLVAETVVAKLQTTTTASRRRRRRWR